MPRWPSEIATATSIAIIVPGDTNAAEGCEVRGICAGAVCAYRRSNSSDSVAVVVDCSACHCQPAARSSGKGQGKPLQ